MLLVPVGRASYLARALLWQLSQALHLLSLSQNGYTHAHPLPLSHTHEDNDAAAEAFVTCCTRAHTHAHTQHTCTNNTPTNNTRPKPKQKMFKISLCTETHWRAILLRKNIYLDSARGKISKAQISRSRTDDRVLSRRNINISAHIKSRYCKSFQNLLFLKVYFKVCFKYIAKGCFKYPENRIDNQTYFTLYWILGPPLDRGFFALKAEPL